MASLCQRKTNVSNCIPLDTDTVIYKSRVFFAESSQTTWATSCNLAEHPLTLKRARKLKKLKFSRRVYDILVYTSNNFWNRLRDVDIAYMHARQELNWDRTVFFCYLFCFHICFVFVSLFWDLVLNLKSRCHFAFWIMIFAFLRTWSVSR